MNIQEILWSFLKLHPVEAFTNFFILFIYYPVEIIVLSILFSRVYDQLNGVKRNPVPLIKEMTVLIAVLLALEFMMDYREWLNSSFYPELEKYTRNYILTNVIKTLSTNFYELDMGDLQSRLSKIPWTVSTIYDYFNKYIAPFVFTVIGITIFIYTIDVKLGLISTIFMVIYLFAFWLLYKNCLEKSRIRDKAEDAMMEQIDDKIRNLMNIFTTGEQKNELDTLRQLQTEFAKTSTDEFRFRTKIDLMVGLLDFFYFIAMMALTIYMRKELSQAKIVLMVTLMIFFIRHLRMFSAESLVSSYFIGTVIENNKFFTDLENNKVQKVGTQKNFISKGHIRFHNLSFIYHGNEVFSNFNATIEPRQIALIYGKSGSGKSTILKLIQGFYKPSQGSIFIDGVNIQDADLTYLRDHITYVPQHSILFHGSIIHNIAYGTGYSEEEAQERVSRLPIITLLGDNLSRDVGKLGNSLSGGQRQIVLLLRAYLRKNPIVLVDEPTASVDKENRELVYDMLEKMSKESTVVIISHDEGMYKITEKIIPITS